LSAPKVTEDREIKDPKTGKIEFVEKTRELTAEEKAAARDPNRLYTCRFAHSGGREARLLNWMCSVYGEGVKPVLDDEKLENANWTDRDGKTALW
jgi:hypothetical protein